jgi:predicted RNase H-like nuclease
MPAATTEFQTADGDEGAILTIVRGVDGCPAGWLCVSLDVEGRKPIARIFADAEALLRDGDCAVTAIDIPIGLTSARARRCDIEARRLLGACPSNRL